MDEIEINEENYGLYLANAAVIGMRLGKSAEKIAQEIKNVVENFEDVEWRRKSKNGGER